MKKLPIGIQTFSEIIEDGYYYVDKTKLVAKLYDKGKYYFLSRPRRFGKSLFLDTLKEAFSGSKELFTGLYLEKNWDWSKKYPIIKISFGGGVIQKADELEIVVQEMLNERALEYSIEFKNHSVQGKFRELINTLHEKYKEKVVILIDEYDKPILDNIDKPETALQVREGLKNLYSVIKDSDAHIRFVFITGVSKFSKVNLFSGLNNLSDITLNENYATICGYTHAELINIFKERLENVSLEEVKVWYNGYNFLGEKVYNPFDVLLYLDSKIFKNYWFETGTPTFLIKLIKENNYNVPDIEKATSSESLLSSFDIGNIGLITLLFQTGYLTIKNKKRLGSTDFYELGYPNLEVKHSLTEVILHFLADNSQQQFKNIQSLYNLLLGNKLDDLKTLFHSFFASIPYEWYRKNEIANYEGYYASIFYCYFTAIGLEVIAEDSTNHGKIDMTVILKNRCFIFEFKVNELTVAGNALAQLKEKKYQEKYIGYKSEHLDSGNVEEIYLIGVEFSKVDRNITNFEWVKFL